VSINSEEVQDLDATNLGEFKQHLPTCQCKGFQRVNDYDLRGAQMLLRHLQQTAVISVTDRTATAATMPALFVTFRDWMRQHHGTRDTTLETYRRTIVHALQALGTDPQRFDAARLRDFVLVCEQARPVSGQGGDHSAAHVCSLPYCHRSVSGRLG
jgi:hypothetical protein